MTPMEDDGRLNLAALIPLLCSIALMQMIVPLVRIATSYRAIELQMGVWQVGALSSGFALLPVLFAVRIGRYNDRHGERTAALAGVAVVAMAFLGLWLMSSGFAPILLFTCLLGIGHVLMLSAVQLMTTRCSGPSGHDRVLGHFLVAASLGQVAGPLVIGLATPPGDLYPDQALYHILAGSVVLLIGAVILLWRAIPPAGAGKDAAPLPLRTIFQTRGLWAILLANSLCTATNDLILVFFPVFGAERGIDAATVGYLFSLRALATLASRFFFLRLVIALGKPTLMMSSLLLTALTTAGLVFELPVWGVGTLLAVSGFTMGLAIGASLSLTIEIAPPESKATAMSLRLTLSRLAQFALPLGAGLVAAGLGAGSIFAISGLGLLACGAVLLGARR